MHDTQIKVLLIEDHPGDAGLIREMLKDSGVARYELTHADSLLSGIEYLLKNEYGIVLLDYDMPESRGISILNKILSLALKLPIVALTNNTDETSGIVAVQKGIQNYLRKDRLDSKLLVHAIHHAIERKKLENALVRNNEFVEQYMSKSALILERTNKKMQLSIEAFKLTRERLVLLFHAIEQSHSVIMITDKYGNIGYVNPRCEQLTGYPTKEVVGKNPRIFASGETSKEAYKHLWDTITSGGVWYGRFCNKKKNGEFYWELATISSVINSEGVTTNFIAVKEDITELVLTERKQKESEEKLRILIESSHDGILAYDRDIRYTLWNKAMEQLSGMKREEVLGKSPFDLFLFINKIDEGEAFRMAVKGEAKINAAMPYIIPQTGRRGYFESAHFPLYDINGAITGGMAIIRDVTVSIRLEEEQTALREQLYHIQKLESVGTLAGGIAHDFNNLLAIILGYGNMLEKSIGNDNLTRQYVQKILKSAERAAKLVQGLLAFSRKQESCQIPIGINKTLVQIKDLLSRLIGEDIVLDMALTDNEYVVMADSGQIEQVLMNLATNARDAMPNGGRLSIHTDIVELDSRFIRAYGYGEAGEYVCISVADTGVGMDEETQKSIFEPFFTTKEPGKGTGLGLSSVYGIVKQHRGYLTVKSEPAKGAAFRIYLPIIKEMPEEGKPEPLPACLTGTETILVAEDEAEVRRLAKALLEEAGYKVIEADDGDDTIDKFRENKDDVRLLLLDVIMPKKGGKEAYNEIKKLRPEVKALFMSGYSKRMVDKKIVHTNESNFLSKPFTQTALLKKVRELLDSSLEEV